MLSSVGTWQTDTDLVPIFIEPCHTLLPFKSIYGKVMCCIAVVGSQLFDTEGCNLVTLLYGNRLAQDLLLYNLDRIAEASFNLGNGKFVWRRFRRPDLKLCTEINLCSAFMIRRTCRRHYNRHTKLTC